MPCWCLEYLIEKNGFKKIMEHLLQAPAVQRKRFQGRGNNSQGQLMIIRDHLHPVDASVPIFRFDL
jgi:hypothetical protein